MINEKLLKQLGEADLKISGLKLWVHGRQFPDMDDYWDGNWLNVTAYCSAAGSSVMVSGSFIHVPEIRRLHDSIVALNTTLTGSAALECIEPELSVLIQAESPGHLVMVVNITPNHLDQTHEYTFELDQSYLTGLISDCTKILVKYPIKDSDEPNDV